MTKRVYPLIFSILLVFASTIPVLAAPPQEDLNALLADLGMTQDELQSYLDYYEMSLDDFVTIEDLQFVLGTPITEDNLSILLSDYGMTRPELDALLAEFGETVEDDYWFIEDLDSSIDFYINHEQYMMEAEEFLTSIGLTEDEVNAFFTHLTALDQMSLDEQMEQLSTRLESFMTMDPETALTDAQIQELSSVYSDMMISLNLNPKYFLEDASGGMREVTLGELLAMQDPNGQNLVIEMYDTQGTLLLDMKLTEDMLTSEYLFEAANELTHVGELAGELTDVRHETHLMK